MKRSVMMVRTLMFAGAALGATGAPAQGYPAKPIRCFVGYTPGGTADILARLVGQKLTIALPEIRNRLSGEGAEFVGDGPEQFTAFIKAEIMKWGKAVKASGAKPE